MGLGRLALLIFGLGLNRWLLSFVLIRIGANRPFGWKFILVTRHTGLPLADFVGDPITSRVSHRKSRIPS